MFRLRLRFGGEHDPLEFHTWSVLSASSAAADNLTQNRDKQAWKNGTTVLMRNVTLQANLPMCFRGSRFKQAAAVEVSPTPRDDVRELCGNRQRELRAGTSCVLYHRWAKAEELQ